ncbi:hypothetical protein HELRODRAFT_180097 [Helobdella robusta]|uniref:SH3 domain-binding glutamic acid-rich-like protein n=1 Tax=Helobdella robusta TaxID=6412 RepID=T1FFG8_HELRO|nr:hypothetical protein HELRODRAFT_180097 [Helobdella robusta]ESN94765.1 hypothetical protein HELRODRAFT_180097 [Helobdella robusta]
MYKRSFRSVSYENVSRHDTPKYSAIYTMDGCEMKKEQDYIRRVLESKRIKYEEVDLADPNHQHEKNNLYQFLSSLAPASQDSPDNHSRNLPPQLFSGNSYRGDFNKFFEAVESERLYGHLCLEIPEFEVEYFRTQRQQQQQQQQQQQHHHQQQQ